MSGYRSRGYAHETVRLHNCSLVRRISAQLMLRSDGERSFEPYVSWLRGGAGCSWPLSVAGGQIESALPSLSGVYDVKSAYRNLLRKGGKRDVAIATNIEQEAGATDESFAARSIPLTDLGIPVPVLLLHGTADTNTPVEHSLRLQKHLVERGGFARLVTFEGQEHHAQATDTEREIDRFIGDVLRLSRTKADTDRAIQSREEPE